MTLTKLEAATFLATLTGLTLLACSTSSEPSDAGTQDAAPGTRDDADEIPCEPRRVLQTVCQQCHSQPPTRGAPFPLVNRSDVLVVRSGVVVGKLMIEQLEAGRMPLSPVTIEEGQKATLLAWLRQGGPAVPPQSCPDSDADAASARQ
jgi:hypothetical protein